MIDSILKYGALCMRVGDARAQAIMAKKAKRKKDAAIWWAAYYAADKEKEACFKTIRDGLATVTPKRRR